MEDLFIIKIGGETLNSGASLNNCLEAIADSGKNIILVHGGGKKVTELASKLGIKQELVEGRRITSGETMELCTMVYAGLISKNLVAKLSSKGKKAVGISGADFSCICSKKREDSNIDYGFVGDIEKVDGSVFNNFIENKVIPVVCSVTMGENFELLNTNADTMASQIAVEMASDNKVHLIYCFEKNGVLLDVSNENSLIEELSQQNFNKMKEAGQIADGMIPKLHNAYRALFHGVEEVKIINSNFLKKYFEGKTTGTTIKLH